MDAWRVDELSESEKKAIGALPGEQSPRAEVEEAIVAELWKRGRLRRSRSGMGWKIAASAAATIALVALIFKVSAVRGRAPAPPEPHWVLLLREGREDRSVPEEEARRRVSEYATWARASSAKGLMDGEKLVNDGILFTPEGQSPVVRTPTSIAGYFLLRETREEDARALAASCPHLKYGGEIELREIWRGP